MMNYEFASTRVFSMAHAEDADFRRGRLLRSRLRPCRVFPAEGTYKR